MFFHGAHKDLINSIEAIGAGFAVYEHLPETNLQQGAKVAEKLRKLSEEMRLQYESNEIRFTISAGVQEYDQKHSEIDQIINAVDKCLYRAKLNGRNQVSIEE